MSPRVRAFLGTVVTVLKFLAAIGLALWAWWMMLMVADAIRSHTDQDDWTYYWMFVGILIGTFVFGLGYAIFSTKFEEEKRK